MYMKSEGCSKYEGFSVEIYRDQNSIWRMFEIWMIFYRDLCEIRRMFEIWRIVYLDVYGIWRILGIQWMVHSNKIRTCLFKLNLK
jgi:hypothetical protein